MFLLLGNEEVCLVCFLEEHEGQHVQVDDFMFSIVSGVMRVRVRRDDFDGSGSFSSRSARSYS